VPHLRDGSIVAKVGIRATRDSLPPNLPMPTLSESAIATLLIPYLTPPAAILPQLSAYLDLLLKWNARTNLTAIREPEEIVRRHFGESLFAARHIPVETKTLLDFGSGAGFPGLPIAVLHPKIQVTLAESQNKKSTFLREAVRTLGLQNVEIWPSRVESMPANRLFNVVALRAVDEMATALPVATSRIAPGGQLLLLTTAAQAPAGGTSIPLPNSKTGILHIEHSQQVP
jgi:16S rRNA (guanine527-N7)-methyltransferase